MPYGVLGPTLGGGAVATGGARVRALLARLLLDAGRIVPLPRLIDDLYGDTPPAGAVNALQSNVSRLRRELPISYDGSGYRLDVEPGEVDVHRFTRLASSGHEALRASSYATAAELLTEALSLWRGEALADVRSAPFAPAAADLLSSRRRQAVEGRVEAELLLRPSGDAVDELRALVGQEPLREHTWALLMRALVAGGRPAEALTAFEQARRILRDELGADPSAELRAVHASVLRGSPTVPRHRLPSQLTSFVGRDDELARVSSALGTARLVTLVGAGGAGKTRLSLEAAGRFEGDACFVELAAGTGPGDVPRAMLDALGLRDGGLLGDRLAGPAAAERLVAALSTRELLLVLDNCEHVVAAVAALAGLLLTACPGLRVLATSREPLGVTGEVRVPVGGLPAEAAVRLFAERAADVLPGFTLTGDDEVAARRIVRTLDGLPLAVELAAARLPVLPVGELARRVDDRFRVLSRGSSTAAERHRTLRAVVAWSWDLLTAEERTLAARFTVFRGSAGLDAIEQLGGLGTATLDVLDGLVTKSLIERDGTRYRMLATIKAFCAEQLSARDDVLQAHAAYFLALAQDADAHLRGPEQLDWLARLDADRDNLHAALRHGSDEVALRLVAALSFYWWLRGARSEASALAQELLDRVGPEAPPGLAEEFVLTRLNAALSGDPLRAGEHPTGYLETLTHPPRQPFLLYLSAFAAGPPVEGEEELLDLHSALRSRLRADPWSEALATIGSGWIAVFRGDRAHASVEFERGLAGFGALGERWGTMLARSGLAELATLNEDHKAARPHMDEALRLAVELRSQVDLADLHRSRGDARMLSGDAAGAAEDFALSVSLSAESGAPELLASSRHGLGRLALRRGDVHEARALCLLALAECPTGWYTADGTRLTIYVTLGRVAEASGDPAEAAHWYRQVTPDIPGPDAAQAVAQAEAALAGLRTER
ncbi:ATP-binding protein [Actinoplanes solisilvae]|uniref:ATP-binding protein n=1 Tax=Actinoplanes solisilvae TaxID=2486853 RepID=UPI0013E29C02|nr:AfsR/SARP family transcriptional regulator [Actinoplanes solisilvae]